MNRPQMALTRTNVNGTVRAPERGGLNLAPTRASPAPLWRGRNAPHPIHAPRIDYGQRQRPRKGKRGARERQP